MLQEIEANIQQQDQEIEANIQQQDQEIEANIQQQDQDRTLHMIYFCHDCSREWVQSHVLI